MPARKKGSPPRGAPRRRRSRELKASQLRWVCRPADHDLSVAARDMSMIGIIGQERAIEALKLGIQLYSPGYNVFVCGISGTGRATTVQRILDRIKGFCPVSPDRCYVHNFAKPDEPKLLTLPRDHGARLRDDMERFRTRIQREVAEVLDRDDQTRKRAQVTAHYESKSDRLIERFERRAEHSGFALKRVRDGDVTRPELFPIIQGRSHAIADLEKLVALGKLGRKKVEAVLRQYEALRLELDGASRQARALIAEMEAEQEEIDRQQVRAVLEAKVGSMAKRYPANGRDVVAGYLNEVIEEVVSHLPLFRRSSREGGAAGGSSAVSRTAEEPGDDDGGALRRVLDRFRVNLIFDSRHGGDCPVVVETHPSYRRLFGYFEKSLDQSGHWTADFMQIRSGSILAADGGYLVLTAEDLFSEPDVWKELKRTLISRRLAINEEKAGGGIPTITMKPQAIPLNVKVILIGQRDSYERLNEEEPDFRKVFKVLAEFDQEMKRTPRTLRQYAAFVQRICKEENLGTLEPAAIAAVAEYGARLAGSQNKLSTRFGDLADLLRESDYWRRQSGTGRKIRAVHVLTAIRESLRRRDLTEEKYQEMVQQNQIFIDVKGRRTGQVNGLVIHDTGSHQFGLPARITATVSPGTAGIINIEREADMSGSSHTKGVLIIGGFFREAFGAVAPIAFTASLAIEQSYGGIDGDSASSTEVYALLSALSGLPIKQELAVTGSVDQKGVIQPIGGINHKIEGFYKVCRAKGLTGSQGVILPEANLSDLMLDEEVVTAVRRGRFHIYPVSTIQEGIEILTDVSAGERDQHGRFTEQGVFGRVTKRLDQFNEVIRTYPAVPRL